MKAVLHIAGKEVREACATAGSLAPTLLLAALALTLAFLGSAPDRDGRRRGARGDRRQPLQPDDLPAAADSPAAVASMPSSARWSAAPCCCC